MTLWWLRLNMQSLHLNEINHSIFVMFWFTKFEEKNLFCDNCEQTFFPILFLALKCDELLVIFFFHCTVNSSFRNRKLDFCFSLTHSLGFIGKAHLIKHTGDNFPITLLDWKKNPKKASLAVFELKSEISNRFTAPSNRNNRNSNYISLESWFDG